jgi:putative hydrolase of the HAD superfamily
MRSLPDAVLLDLDDTILDDTGGLIASWREACHVHRSTMNGFAPEVLFDAIDRTREWYWSDPERHRIGRLELAWARGEVVRLALLDIGVDDPDLARRIGESYHALRDQAIKPFDDAVATVQWLREQGCRLALLTNGGSRGQRDKINRFGLAPMFDSILVEGEIGFGKPDPRIYARALSELGVAAARPGWLATISSGTLPGRSAKGSPASGSMRAAVASLPVIRCDRIESSVALRS